MDEIQPRLAFQNRMFSPQQIDNPIIAELVLMETSLTALCYGFGAVGKLKVFEKSDRDNIVDIVTLYIDAISLALGTLTVHVPHYDTCNRLICNCKIH